jgi:DNA-binding CsgD family transcriptional regulator
MMILELHQQSTKLAAIALQLGIGRRTVEGYVGRSFLKPPMQTAGVR